MATFIGHVGRYKSPINKTNIGTHEFAVLRYALLSRLFLSDLSTITKRSLSWFINSWFAHFKQDGSSQTVKRRSTAGP